MLLLALDTATAAVSVALHDGERVLAGSTTSDPRRHGELLTPAVADVLGRSGRSAAELTEVVVGVGPGPYTSLRVGLVTALAFGEALGVPVAGVCSLDALAGDEPDVAVVTDARRREVYWARYRAGTRVEGPAVERPNALAERLAGDRPLVLGPGADLYPGAFAGLDHRPGRTLDAAALAAHRLAGRALLPVVPLYLRRPDARVPAAARPVAR